MDYNSTVKKGQVIAELDKTNLISELKSATSQLQGAKSDLDYQKSNFNRMKTLFNKGLISANEYESARLSLQQAESVMGQRQEAVNKAQTNLGYATITSPIDGVVLSKSVEEGQTVASSFSTPTLFTIVKDMTDMRVIASVDEADIGQVKVGQRVTYTVDAYPDETFEGTVTQVRNEATTDNNVVTYEVVISAHNPDLKLKPGLTANVTIYTMEQTGILSVPTKALRFTPTKETVGPKDKIVDCQGTHKVWVREGNTFKAYSVQIGITNGTRTQILSGIKEGAVVVVDMKEAAAETEDQTASDEGGSDEKSPFSPGPPSRKKSREECFMEINIDKKYTEEKFPQPEDRTDKKVVIELDNVRRNFVVGDEIVHALKGVSFKIYEGEFVTIMGTSGSGKSTLLNQLGCLDTPSSGEYYLDGVSVRTMRRSERAVLRNRKIGFVFQNYNLLPKTTAVENVELPLMYNAAVSAKERRERSIEALKMVGLGERLYHKSNQMSGGQMQRVAIARALVNDPAVILADEATGNLDTRTSFEILVLFQKLFKAGRTIIFVTHNPEIALYSSRNIFLRDGLILEDVVNHNIQSAAKALAELPPVEE